MISFLSVLEYSISLCYSVVWHSLTFAAQLVAVKAVLKLELQMRDGQSGVEARIAAGARSCLGSGKGSHQGRQWLKQQFVGGRVCFLCFARSWWVLRLVSPAYLVQAWTWARSLLGLLPCCFAVGMDGVACMCVCFCKAESLGTAKSCARVKSQQSWFAPCFRGLGFRAESGNVLSCSSWGGHLPTPSRRGHRPQRWELGFQTAITVITRQSCVTVCLDMFVVLFP